MFLEIFTAMHLPTDLLALAPNERPMHMQFATVPAVERQKASDGKNRQTISVRSCQKSQRFWL